MRQPNHFPIIRIALIVWSIQAAPSVIALDCNGNGIDDTTDIAGGTSADCNTCGTSIRWR